MLTETARVFSVEPDYLTAEVVQQSTCGNCSAQKGCGQGVLAKYLTSSHYVRIRLTDRSSSEFSVGDQIELGIDEFAMLRAAFLVYLIPLVLMIAGTYLGSLLSELFSIIFAVVGLFVGGAYARFESQKRVQDPAYSPVIVDDRSVVRIVAS